MAAFFSALSQAVFDKPVETGVACAGPVCWPAAGDVGFFAGLELDSAAGEDATLLGKDDGDWLAVGSDEGAQEPEPPGTLAPACGLPGVQPANKTGKPKVTNAATVTAAR